MTRLVLMAIACWPAPSASAGTPPSAGERASVGVQERYDWRATWSALERLATLPVDSPQRGSLATELEALALARERDSRTLRDRPAVFRARLLRAEVARLLKKPAAPLADPRTEVDFAPGEAWLAAQHLPPCALRTRAFREALSEADPNQRGERRARALHAVFESVRSGEFAHAESLARWLQADRDDDAAAAALMRVLAMSGREQDALDVFEDSLARRLDAEGREQLLWERARLEHGHRRDITASRWTGSALLAGSSDALLAAARTALAVGHADRARQLTRSLFPEDSVHPDAWRGWGLSLVVADPAPSPSRTTNPGNR